MRITAFTLILFLTGCGCCRHLATSTSTRDSTKVEIRHRTVWILDTMKSQLPAERTEQTVRQDSSHLETSAAISDAWINPDGSLTHSLENKPTELAIPVQRPIEYRDSIVYRDRATNAEYVVEAKRELTWWQRLQIRGFWGLLVILMILCRRPAAKLLRY